ncbi:MAG TPA: DUF885 family protein [Caulobacteraceae bacterium]|nr:DUF885 family protein [Caulobacteraceae bacterium]
MTELTRRGLAALPTAALAMAAEGVGARAAQAEGGASADGPEAAKFKAIYEAEWAWRNQQFPDDEDESKPLAPYLPDDSASSQAARLARWRQTLAALDALDARALGDADQINLAVYRGQIEARVASWAFGDWQAPFNSDSSFWGDMAFPARSHSFRTEADYRGWIARLGQTPRWFDQQTAAMRLGLGRGFTPPKATLTGRDQSVALVAAAAPEATEFYHPFTAMPDAFAPALRAELAAAGRAVIADKVIPAHQRLLEFLRQEYLPHCRDSIAANALPDGAAYYRSKIREFTTLDLAPEEIHAIGLSEGARIRAEMDAVMAEAKFAGGLPAFLQFLRTDPQFYVSTPQALLDRAAWTAKTFDGKARLWFGRLPRARFGIRPVPPALAPFYTAGRGGLYEYLVNTYDLPARPLYSLTALTLHESAPGHAFQIPLALETPGQPAFRRKGYISAYGEGWAVYCERLGVEMGMYATPYERFGMLSYQAWRAARLVVDTGVHALGWSRQRAIDYVAANTALSQHEVTTEVDRYISWPAQALSYYLGAMAIWRARHRAEQALGPKFDIRNFHDAVLELGSVPLSVVEARTDRFITAGGPSPYPQEV